MVDAPTHTDVDGVAVPVNHLIGGSWLSSPSTFETRSPLDWTADSLADVARGDEVGMLPEFEAS